MLTNSIHHRIYRISAWYDLLVSWPFAMPLTLGLYWTTILTPLCNALGLPPLTDLDPHAVLFGNFFGTIVVLWSILRLRQDNPRLAVWDGVGRIAFSVWMLWALMQGVTPLIWAFLIPEIAFAILQLIPPRIMRVET